MNNDRRKTIKAIALRLDALRDMIEAIKDDIETVRDEEREAFDNMPASLQEGEKGQAIDEAANNIGNAYDELDDVTNRIDEVIGYLSLATGE